MSRRLNAGGFFTLNRTMLRFGNNQGAPMLDLLLAVLGTGGILLMAGYAALCERI